MYYKTHKAYCFSSNCKTHGKRLDVIDFVLHKENTDKHNALLKCLKIINYYEGKVQHLQKPIQLIEAPQPSIPRVKDRCIDHLKPKLINQALSRIKQATIFESFRSA